MAKYNFDRDIRRIGSHTVKWDGAIAEYKDPNIIPLWVADMDFEVPREVKESIEKRIEHEIFGYTMISDSYYEAIEKWYRENYGWEIDSEWIVFSPGVVPGLNAIIRAFSEEGDEIIVQTPVYHQFQNTIKITGRQVVENPLIEEDGKYSMDFENLKELIGPRTKMLILCNPHNPVGRSWREDELKKLGEICLENNILVVSDEIHSDLVYEPSKHRVFSQVDPRFRENSIICTAPNKTFNIAGLKTGNIIIEDTSLRDRYKETLDSLGLSGANLLGLVAQEACYKNGHEWYKEMLSYVEGNIDFAVSYIEENIPKIRVEKPEATYLLCLDCRELPYRGHDLMDFFVKDAGVLLNQGESFGSNYDSHMRMNLATSRKNIEKALEKIKTAIDSL